MPFEYADVIGAEYNKSQLAAFQILLIFQALICRHHDSKNFLLAVRTLCFSRHCQSGYGTLLSNRMRKALAFGELFYRCDEK